jgi:hypothetical protein
VSTTRLRPERRGKAVDALLRDHFSQEQIEKLLARRWPQLRDDRNAFFRNMFVLTPTRWTCERIDDAVIRFAIENDAWPVSSDFGRRNGLPSRGVWKYHDQPDHWCWGEFRALKKAGLAEGHHWASNKVRRDPHPEFWERIVARAPELTASLVLSIPNQVHRRDAVVAFGGFAKLAEAGAGRVIQQDDYGTLWRVDSAEENVADWFSLFVEAVNSTPRMKDDGTGTYVLDLDKKGEVVYDHYFLRVPPHISTAKDAVAWTGYFERRPFRGGGSFPRLGEREFAGFVAQS